MSDAVNHPQHYDVFPDIQAIQLIACSMTKEEYRGYCFGNVLKYRLRVGKKDGMEQEIGKAENYAFNLYTKHNHLCRETSLFLEKQ